MTFYCNCAAQQVLSEHVKSTFRLSPLPITITTTIIVLVYFFVVSGVELQSVAGAADSRSCENAGMLEMIGVLFGLRRKGVVNPSTPDGIDRAIAKAIKAQTGAKTTLRQDKGCSRHCCFWNGCAQIYEEYPLRD